MRQNYELKGPFSCDFDRGICHNAPQNMQCKKMQLVPSLVHGRATSYRCFLRCRRIHACGRPGISSVIGRDLLQVRKRGGIQRFVLLTPVQRSCARLFPPIGICSRFNHISFVNQCMLKKCCHIEWMRRWASILRTEERSNVAPCLGADFSGCITSFAHPQGSEASVCCTYWLNRLQNLPSVCPPAYHAELVIQYLGGM